MDARTLTFEQEMNSNEFYDIPFFQRRYVWNRDNWSDLLKELKDKKTDHFLGSYIVKDAGREDGSNIRRNLIVDGQQRFTTLSILLKVCRDICVAACETTDDYYGPTFDRLMKVNVKGRGYQLKIRHSMVDGPAFRKMMVGDSRAEMLSGQIAECAEYFHKELDGQPDVARDVFDTLVGDSCQMVKIGLAQEDNEQIIFDTINSAGVRLTSADIVKNAIFQHLKELCSEERVREYYQKFWTNVFDFDAVSVAYWSDTQQKGRVSRARIELLLQCVGVIEEIYDPENHSLEELADCYKRALAKKDETQTVSLVEMIAEYAELYRDSFGRVDKGVEYSFADDCQRLIHILQASDISTFDPLVLKMLKGNQKNGIDALSREVCSGLKALETYVMRHIVTRASTKNFNKECAMVISGKKTIDDYYKEKAIDLSDEQVRAGLRNIQSNNQGKLILFWMELKKRDTDRKVSQKKLVYNCDLEHILPQDWIEHWSSVPVVNVSDGSVVLDEKDREEVRNAAIREIGNMTLLNGSLNRAIHNNTLEVKIKGDGRKGGVEKYNDYLCTKEVLERAKLPTGGYHWDEKSIRERTEQITSEFLKIW